MFKTNSQSQKHYSTNKQYLSANGFSLLPLALRPCLFLTIAIVFTAALLNSIFCDGAVFATASTLALSVDSDSLLLELKPTSSNGTFASSTGHINIGANTNNAAGYTLKLAAKTADDRTLSDTDGNGLSPLAAATTLDDFSDDAESGVAYNNKWGYLPSRRCAII